MSFTIPNLADAAFPEQAEVDSGDTRIIQQGIRDLGVVSGCGVTAQGTPNMTVAVASGSVRWDTDLVSVTGGNVTIEPADGTNARFDLIQVTSAGALVNPTAGDGKGIADPEPVFPVHLNFRVVLAVVYVPALDNDIDADQIIDKRMTLATPYVPPSNHVSILHRSTADVELQNSTAGKSLYSYTIPGGTLGATGGIRLTAVGQVLNDSGGTHGLRFMIKLGSENSLISNYTQLFPSDWWRRWHLVAWFLNANHASAQNWGAVVTIGASQNGSSLPIWESSGVWSSHLGIGLNNSGAVNTGSNQLLDLRAQFDGAHTTLSVVKMAAFLELLPPA